MPVWCGCLWFPYLRSETWGTQICGGASCMGSRLRAKGKQIPSGDDNKKSKDGPRLCTNSGPGLRSETWGTAFVVELAPSDLGHPHFMELRPKARRRWIYLGAGSAESAKA